MAYLIALGSNMPHGRFGSPRRVIIAALEVLGLPLAAVSTIVETAPIGPSRRRYANAVALAETAMPPVELLEHLKTIEAAFGRRSGQRWGARVLDLDIILWTGGIWSSPGLAIPHPAFRARAFVLGPSSDIASGWRDPVTRLSLRQLKARLDRKRPCP